MVPVLDANVPCEGSLLVVIAAIHVASPAAIHQKASFIYWNDWQSHHCPLISLSFSVKYCNYVLVELIMDLL